MAVKSPTDDPNYVAPDQVQELGGDLKLLTFPGGFGFYAHSSIEESTLIYNEVFVKEEYLSGDASLEGCRCVFDVGANIGLFTVFAKTRNPDLVVHAFEPIGPTYDVLLKNIELHGLNGVHAHNFALGNQDGSERQITFYPHAAGNSTSSPESKEDLKRTLTEMIGAEKTAYLFGSPQVHTVRSRTLSAVLDEEGIAAVDLLKMDAEGDELAVLQGIRDEHFPGIRQIAAEIHGGALLDAIRPLLAGKGYRVSFDDGLTGENNTNLFAIR